MSLPLPTPAVQPSELIPGAGGVLGALYTAEQMRAYGQSCREQALEDAALICNGEKWMDSGKKSIDYIRAFNEGCADCEAAIRRLK